MWSGGGAGLERLQEPGGAPDEGVQILYRAEAKSRVTCASPDALRLPSNGFFLGKSESFVNKTQHYNPC
jgi:hypothetical protein